MPAKKYSVIYEDLKKKQRTAPVRRSPACQRNSLWWRCTAAQAADSTAETAVLRPYEVIAVLQ